ncbi:MAG TPA: M67 family metallopeptidase [Candidatus Acidoferrales bacterium]|jgi:proteasome lid subunit RPN8/RPN11|nr:M67 family metallopeptidase [Candidatus Acidoferrales bacterium]
MADSVRVLPEILDAMLAHARRESHIECCGLLAGRDRVITAIFAATNALASPVAYEIAPQELFELFRTLRTEGLQHLGQYHSHLSTENVPSPSDIEQAGYPEQAYFIVSLRQDAPKPVRAFAIRDGGVREFAIVRGAEGRS